MGLVDTPADAWAPVEGARFVDVSVESFQKAGLLWFVNRALHPFGFALSATLLKDGVTGESRIIEERGLRILRTTDPIGLTFSPEDEDASRMRFFAFLGRRFGGGL